MLAVSVLMAASLAVAQEAREAAVLLPAYDTVALCLDRQDTDVRACIGEYTEDCMRQVEDGATLGGMVGCTRAEYEAWDAALYRTYLALLDRQPEAPAGALQAAQRAWTAKREADCTFRVAILQGSRQSPLERVNCLLHETAERTLTLREWAQDAPLFR